MSCPWLRCSKILFENAAPSEDLKRSFLRVTRLDGPTVADVKRLIDDSIQAEAEGLMGRAYIDLGGPHKEGDQWIREAGELAEAAYFDTDFEQSRRSMDHRNRLDGPVIYMGWYRPHALGPWRDKRWDVSTGAIGFHLHSFSATTVRSATRGWVGPMVAQGYCATVGNVYEPYLHFTHRPQHLLKQLLLGRSFGEAAAYSYPVASWMGIAIGDPLYRPFAVSLDSQLEALEAHPNGAYVVLREINRMTKEKGEADALRYARSQFMERPTLPLAYRLASMYKAQGEPSKALEVLGVLRYIEQYAKEEIVLVQQMADLLMELGEQELAYTVYGRLLSETKQPKALRIQLLATGSQVARANLDMTTASKWSLELKQLKQPPTKQTKKK